MNIDVFKSFDVEFKGALVSAKSIDNVLPEDEFQYNLLGCTWFSLLKEWSDLSDFLYYVQTVGLYTTIDMCSKFSFELLSHQFDFRDIPDEIKSLAYGWCDHIGDLDLQEDDIFYLATILRYPKRLCVGNTNLKQSCIDEFLSHNQVLGQYDRELRWWLDKHQYMHGNDLRCLVLSYMKDYIFEWIGESPYGSIPTCEHLSIHSLTRDVNKYNRAVERYNESYRTLEEEDFLDLSDGVCADCKTKDEKLSILASRQPLDYPGVPYLRSTPTFTVRRVISDRFHTPITHSGGQFHEGKVKSVRYIDNNEVQFGSVMGVPKTYDEYRIVVKEQSYRLAKSKKLANLLADILLKVSNGMVDVHDQSVNQEAARLGSVDGSTSTIDWSHASDGYSYQTARAVLPPAWFDAIDRRRAQFLYVPVGKENFDLIQNNIFLTMGHTLTPSVQSLFFYALCFATCDIYELFTNIAVDRTRISVYNDDTVIPTEVAAFLFECGKAIGLIPNEKKSFISSEFLFREACGVEYFHGITMTQHLYWPRTRIAIRSMKDFPSYFPTLMSIQHALFNKRAASNGLCDLFTTIFPNMTWSDRLRDDTSDLVRIHRTVKKVFPPIDWSRVTDRDAFESFLEDNDLLREIHLQARSTWPRCKETDISYAEYLCYLLYLREGPLYDDPWSELAHCSTRRNPSQFATDPVTQVSSIRA